MGIGQQLIAQHKMFFTSGSTAPRFCADASEEVKRRADKIKLDSRGTMGFSAAMKIVLQNDPELAKEYVGLS